MTEIPLHSKPDASRMQDPGTLYLIPTPVGNLGDMTYRAVEVLRGVDLVACEDTRTSAHLLQHYGVDTPRTAYHMRNEHRKTPEIVERLLGGSSVALVTDAGSPAISDPGYLLVRAAVQAGVRVEALPGATAFVPAITASGLPCDRFVFEGFLPAKKGRGRRIGELALEERTVVLYASPHRLEKLLADLSDAFGKDRPAVACRELTKRFETYHRGTLGTLLDWARSKERIRGEIVLVIAGASYHARLAREGGDSGPAS